MTFFNLKKDDFIRDSIFFSNGAVDQIRWSQFEWSV